jgi:hypothetical protein
MKIELNESQARMMRDILKQHELGTAEASDYSLLANIILSSKDIEKKLHQVGM